MPGTTKPGRVAEGGLGDGWPEAGSFRGTNLGFLVHGLQDLVLESTSLFCCVGLVGLMG